MGLDRDYFKIEIGGSDPYCGKKVETLILRSSSFIVYLDEESVIQWSHACSVTSDFGCVINRVSILEAASDFLNGTKHLKPIRGMMGEAIARMLDGQDFKNASEILDQAEKLIQLRNREYSRRWFFASVLVSAAAFAFLFLFTVLEKNAFITLFSQNAFIVVTTGLLGSVGAVASVCIRNNDLHLDANAGLSLHVLEGFARVLIGVIAGVVLALLMKGGLVLEVVQKAEHNFYLFWAFGLLAGASERMLPGFILQVDGLTLNKQLETGANKDEK
jgi:hypothetical protein